MIFKDANSGFNAATQKNQYVYRFNDIVKLQENNNIAERTMYNYSYYLSSVKELNQSTIDQCVAAGEDNIPVLRLFPPSFQSDGYRKEELEKLIDDYHPLFRIRPTVDNVIFSDWTFGWMLDYFEERGIPLLIAQDEVDLRDAAAVKSAHAELKILLLNTQQFFNRQFIPFIQHFPNVYMETSCVIEYYGLEMLSDTIGADKILFGTFMPYKEPYDKIFQLMYSELSEEQKEMIAYRNYDMLLKGWWKK